MVNRDKAVVGLGGDLEKNDLVAAVGMGCEYDGCKCVVPLLCVVINDGFERKGLVSINFG